MASILKLEKFPRVPEYIYSIELKTNGLASEGGVPVAAQRPSIKSELTNRKKSLKDVPRKKNLLSGFYGKKW